MKTLLLLLALFLAPIAQANKVLVLVPGFLSFSGSKYFSPDIIKTFRQHGYDVYVASNLNPIGTIRQNGEKLVEALNEIERKRGQKVEFNLLGHSAGGLYSLYAANTRQFNIQNIVTVATPFGGVGLSNQILNNLTGLQQLAQFLNLESMIEFTTEKIQKFLNTISLPAAVKISSFGGDQKMGLNPDTDFRVIPEILMLPYMLASGLNDGLVSLSSANPLMHFKNLKNKVLRDQTSTFNSINLDHIDQVIDYRIMLGFGFLNANILRAEQIKFYTNIVDQLK